jgi:hypothetical protein
MTEPSPREPVEEASAEAVWWTRQEHWIFFVAVAVVFKV